MKRLVAEPLSAAEFAPFGDLVYNAGPGRRKIYPDATKRRDGPGELLFSVSYVKAVSATPFFSITLLERHPYAVQTFLPLAVSRWLIIVAPDLNDESPDLTRMRAFLAGPGIGISYRRGAWHHGTTVLDTDAQFGVLMWRRTPDDDNEFYHLSESIEVDVANCSRPE